MLSPAVPAPVPFLAMRNDSALALAHLAPIAWPTPREDDDDDDINGQDLKSLLAAKWSAPWLSLLAPKTQAERAMATRAMAKAITGQPLGGAGVPADEIDTMNKMFTHDFKDGVKTTARKLSGMTTGFVRRVNADGLVRGREVEDYMAACTSSIGQYAHLPHSWATRP